MNKLDCEVVEDLLPSYIDHLTSEHTNQLIAAHLETCDSCRKLYQIMKEDEYVEETNNINFLKKVKNKNKAILLGIIVVACLICGGFYKSSKVELEDAFVPSIGRYGDYYEIEVRSENGYKITDIINDKNDPFHYIVKGRKVFRDNETFNKQFKIKIPDYLSVYHVANKTIILEGKKEQSAKERIQTLINGCLQNNPDAFDFTYKLLKELGYKDEEYEVTATTGNFNEITIIMHTEKGLTQKDIKYIKSIFDEHHCIDRLSFRIETDTIHKEEIYLCKQK